MYNIPDYLSGMYTSALYYDNALVSINRFVGITEVFTVGKQLTNLLWSSHLQGPYFDEHYQETI